MEYIGCSIGSTGCALDPLNPSQMGMVTHRIHTVIQVNSFFYVERVMGLKRVVLSILAILFSQMALSAAHVGRHPVCARNPFILSSE